MPQFNVVLGDITRMPYSVDAIVTLVDPRDDWNSSTDVAIKEHTHDYHLTLGIELERLLTDNERQSEVKVAYIVEGKKKTSDQSFNDVLFLVDESDFELSTLILIGLQTAQDKGYQRITMPPIGISPTSGSTDILKAVKEIQTAVFAFKKNHPESEMIVDIVVNNDLDSELRQLDDPDDLRQLIEGFLNI